MDNVKIIQVEQGILGKETLFIEQAKKYRGMKNMKIYSLISIPVLILIAYFCANYQVHGSASGYAGTYSSENPYEGLGGFLLLFGVPIAIILAVVGYVKSKKLYKPFKKTSEEIMALKNELIILKNS